jgi:hypothetical protein
MTVVRDTPPKTGRSKPGNRDIGIAPESATATLDRLLAIAENQHQSPKAKAKLSRLLADELSQSVERHFQALDIAPFDGAKPKR